MNWVALAEAGAARATSAATATANVFFLISFEFLSRFLLSEPIN
jgi:hypothetical protein